MLLDTMKAFEAEREAARAGKAKGAAQRGVAGSEGVFTDSVVSRLRGGGEPVALDSERCGYLEQPSHSPRGLVSHTRFTVRMRWKTKVSCWVWAAVMLPSLFPLFAFCLGPSPCIGSLWCPLPRRLDRLGYSYVLVEGLVGGLGSCGICVLWAGPGRLRLSRSGARALAQ